LREGACIVYTEILNTSQLLTGPFGESLSSGKSNVYKVFFFPCESLKCCQNTAGSPDCSILFQVTLVHIRI